MILEAFSLLYIYFFLCCLLTCTYSLFVYWVFSKWAKTPDFNLSSNGTKSPLQILIPARNEAHQIGKTIEKIRQTTFPKDKLQVTIIDDFSTDQTATISKVSGVNINLNILSLSDYFENNTHNSYKKMGIEKGITLSKTEHILMTDADCIAGPDWISTIHDYALQTKTNIATGPVLIHHENSTLEYFQSFDFIGTMAVTAAGIISNKYHLANGANLYINKTAFDEIEGFTGNDNHASGDDVFLMQKMAKYYPGKVAFLKSKKAIVYTQPVNNWKAFFQQRLRWATKTSSYDNSFLKIMLGSIFLFCLSMVGNVIFCLFFGISFLWLFLIQFIVKCITDYLYLNKLAAYFDKSHLMSRFFPSFIIHILYIVTIGFAGLFVKKYSWKGRTVQ